MLSTCRKDNHDSLFTIHILLRESGPGLLEDSRYLSVTPPAGSAEWREAPFGSLIDVSPCCHQVLHHGEVTLLARYVERREAPFVSLM